MFKVKNTDTRTSRWFRSVVFIVNFEHMSHLFLVFLLLTLNRHLFASQREKDTKLSSNLVQTLFKRSKRMFNLILRKFDSLTSFFSLAREGLNEAFPFNRSFFHFFIFSIGCKQPWPYFVVLWKSKKLGRTQNPKKPPVM